MYISQDAKWREPRKKRPAGRIIFGMFPLHVNTYIYIYIYIYTYTHIHIIYTHTYICIYTYTYIHTCVCIHIYIYIYVYDVIIIIIIIIMNHYCRYQLFLYIATYYSSSRHILPSRLRSEASPARRAVLASRSSQGRPSAFARSSQLAPSLCNLSRRPRTIIRAGGGEGTAVRIRTSEPRRFHDGLRNSRS